MDDDQKVSPPRWEDIGADCVDTDRECKRMAEEAGPLTYKPPDRPNPFRDMLRGKHRIPREYLVDEILPCKEVHLIVGASGSGKSTWLYGCFLPDWAGGKPIFGYESNPVPYVVVSMERSIDSVLVTLDRLGAPETPIADGRGCRSLEAAVERGLDVVSDARFFIIEGIATIAPSGAKADYANIGKFLVDAGQFAEQRGFSFAGTAHQPKMHKGESYEDPRQRVLGSVAWAAMSETIILIERDEPGNLENLNRKITLLPRNTHESEHLYLLDEQGKFKPVDDKACDDAMDILINKMEWTFSGKELVKAGKEAGVSQASVYRWLDKTKIVTRMKKGYYVKFG